MFEYLPFLQNISATIGALTAIGGTLIWIYNRTIAKPREKRRLAHEKQQQELLHEALIPINEFLAESGRDRDNLNKIAIQNAEILNRHESRLDQHNDRLIVLEVHNGVRKVSYKEEK